MNEEYQSMTFDEKSFSFKDITLKTGLERLIPNLSEEKRDVVFSIIGHIVSSELTNYSYGENEQFYSTLEDKFNNYSEEINTIQNYKLGKRVYHLLSEEMKSYSLGLIPDKRKVSRFRKKELGFLSKLI